MNEIPDWLRSLRLDPEVVPQWDKTMNEKEIPDWLEPLRQSTERIRRETESIRRETERLRRQNASLKSLVESKKRLKQIVEASTIKPTPMSTPPDPHRQTGRTTRMLTEAFKLAKEGKAVYVLAANSEQMYYMERMADRLFGSGEASALGVKFETPASLTTFDFRTMQLKGAHPNCRTLIDHWTIESEYAIMLSELHRFDIVEEDRQADE